MQPVVRNILGFVIVSPMEHNSIEFWAFKYLDTVSVFIVLCVIWMYRLWHTVYVNVKQNVQAIVIKVIKVTHSLYKCKTECPSNCDKGDCNKIDGSCRCKKGFYGSDCSKGKYTNGERKENINNVWILHLYELLFYFLSLVNFRNKKCGSKTSFYIYDW